MRGDTFRHLDLDESTPHRSDDWLRALSVQELIKEEVEEIIESRQRGEA